MKRWVQWQIGSEIEGISGTVVLLDPDSALTTSDIEDIADRIELIVVSDWLELRRLWDLDVRRSPGTSSRAVLVVSPEFETPRDLPWDIEHEASAVLRVRFPVPADLRPLFRAAGDQADCLVEAAAEHRDPATAVAVAYGIRTGNSKDELDAIARLRLDPTTLG